MFGSKSSTCVWVLYLLPFSLFSFFSSSMVDNMFFSSFWFRKLRFSDEFLWSGLEYDITLWAFIRFVNWHWATMCPGGYIPNRWCLDFSASKKLVMTQWRGFADLDQGFRTSGFMDVGPSGMFRSFTAVSCSGAKLMRFERFLYVNNHWSED